MKAMKASEMAAVMGGSYFGPGDLVVSGECRFDSREVTPGDFFLALKGEATDGHLFVDDAFAKGAALAITTKGISGPHIVVTDVLEAAAKLAHANRMALPDLAVVGITGSQGKTTTKDILRTVLSSAGTTVAPIGSYNNEIGVPVTLLRCDESTKYCIVEMGARHLGDIGKLTEVAQPQVGAVLRVGTAHLGEFGSREGIAKTKGELIRGLKPGATAVLGTYDEFTPQMAAGLPIATVTFGETQGCDVRAADIEIRGGHPHFDLVTPEGRETVELNLLGAHQVANALAAAAIAYVLGLNTQQIASALSSHQQSSKWRMEIHEGGGQVLINDSYNANPESMEAALRTLVLLSQERGGRSWAFLGTMHELGNESPELHRKVSEIAIALGVDHVVAIGNDDYVKEISPNQTVFHFVPTMMGAEDLIKELTAGDCILVKASRAEHLELLAQSIMNSWNREEI